VVSGPQAGKNPYLRGHLVKLSKASFLLRSYDLDLHTPESETHAFPNLRIINPWVLTRMRFHLNAIFLLSLIPIKKKMIDNTFNNLRLIIRNHPSTIRQNIEPTPDIFADEIWTIGGVNYYVLIINLDEGLMHIYTDNEYATLITMCNVLNINGKFEAP
jgi:hypothetical protein